MNTTLFALFISQPIPDHVMESHSRYIEYRNPPVQNELVRALEDDNFDICRKLLHNNCKIGMVDDE